MEKLDYPDESVAVASPMLENITVEVHGGSKNQKNLIR